MPANLIAVLRDFGAPILALSVFLMNAGVPVPGHAAYIAACVLAANGTMSLPIVIASSVPAAFLGAWLGFAIGRRGGHELLVTYGPRLGITAPRVAAMEGFYVRHGGLAIFFTRFVIVVRTFGAFFAGMNEVPRGRFLGWSAAGAVAWGVAYAVGATVFEKSWTIIEDRLGVAGLLGLGSLALLGVAHALLWRRRRR